MLRYLSDEWIQAADDALAQAGLRTALGDRFVVEQRIGDHTYHLIFDGDGAGMRAGPAKIPTISFTQSWATAVAVAQGELSAEEAVLDGQIVLKGDPMELLGHYRILSRVHDVFAEVRANTDWTGPPQSS